MAQNLPQVLGPKNAFAFFVQETRREYEAEHQGEPPASFTEFMRNCSLRWEISSEEYKIPFERLAQLDKIRYETACQNNPRLCLRIAVRTGAGEAKPLNPLSSFYWFCEDNRAVVMHENPGFHIGAVSKELGQRWMNLSKEIRAKYEAIAKEDVERYEYEMRLYEQQKEEAAA